MTGFELVLKRKMSHYIITYYFPAGNIIRGVFRNMSRRGLFFPFQGGLSTLKLVHGGRGSHSPPPPSEYASEYNGTIVTKSYTPEPGFQSEFRCAKLRARNCSRIARNSAELRVIARKLQGLYVSKLMLKNRKP